MVCFFLTIFVDRCYTKLLVLVVHRRTYFSAENLLTQMRPKDSSMDKEEMLIFHLHFADDTIIFCEATKAHLINLLAILRCFEAFNLQESVNVDICTHESKVCSLAFLIGYKLITVPFKDLGLPLVANPGSPSVLDLVIKSFKSKLSS